MLFQTSGFLLFFGVFYLLYLGLASAPRSRQVLLLIGSYAFYGIGSWKFLWLIFLSTWVDFSLGVKIFEQKDEKIRKTWLIASVALNLTLLGIFKYYDFFVGSFDEVFKANGLAFAIPLLKVGLPVGISFYTFESMSYVIDIYRRKIEPVQSLLEYAVFIAFFPHLIAGPIIRPAVFFPELRKNLKVTSDDFYSGLYRFLTGLFKKMFLADILATYWADEIFLTPKSFSSLDLLIGAYAYAFQIYLDFSAYSDMAIGLSRMMGIYLPENFRNPYVAVDIQDFWNRWHISLSTWLRDYLYIPLGGNRKGTLRKYLNIALTMLLGGLWHGANWTFVVWGGLHGLAIVGVHAVKDSLRPTLRWSRPVGMFLTFHFVTFAWIFFRSETIGKARDFITKLFDFSAGDLSYHGPVIVPALLLVCAGAQLLSLRELKTKAERFFVATPYYIKIAACAAAVGCIFIFEQTFKPFIYFQF